ncbi:amidohydrolase family protein [Chitinophaga defluvii]|uniref:Amidohydrolase family protein n=1 Tax=Chitinophaga defluvii TaxID=3163343 RepID=A0ABV2TDB1_9BACT
MIKTKLITLIIASCLAALPVFAQAVLLKNATVIDGNGKTPQQHTDILILADTIAAIGKGLQHPGAVVTDLSGKTVMPALISAHVHVGVLKGTGTAASNYTRENIIRQLRKYEDYGVSHVLTMGTDRPLIFETGIRDSSLAGLLPGARYHASGYGFNTPMASMPPDFWMDLLYRPATAAAVGPQMDALAKVHPAVVKMWVDDFGGSAKKMDPAICKAIIDQAHRHHLRAAAHLYYLEDAHKLVAGGLDIIAHSIRDKEVDQSLLSEMKKKGVIYIPTLSLDEFAYIYARQPDWINDDFFKASLEPGVYEMVTSTDYQQKLKNAPAYDKNVAAFETALRNVKKIHDAGIIIALGTDSGASPVRTQGFSEHLELELLVQAGLTPLQAITAATKNAARALQISAKSGTLAKGKTADLIILSANPEQDIKNTRKIIAVYKAGQLVSNGPLSK